MIRSVLGRCKRILGKAEEASPRKEEPEPPQPSQRGKGAEQNGAQVGTGTPGWGSSREGGARGALTGFRAQRERAVMGSARTVLWHPLKGGSSCGNQSSQKKQANGGVRGGGGGARGSLRC